MDFFFVWVFVAFIVVYLVDKIYSFFENLKP